MLSALFAAKSLADYGRECWLRAQMAAEVVAEKGKKTEQAYDVLQGDAKGHSLLKKYLTKEVRIARFESWVELSIINTKNWQNSQRKNDF